MRFLDFCKPTTQIIRRAGYGTHPLPASIALRANPLRICSLPPATLGNRANTAHVGRMAGRLQQLPCNRDG
jgi:hypothetical protein